VDQKSDAGGLIGSFFMALTLAIVSFSCTGPILGSLLVGSISKDGGAFQLTLGMAGFGLALALPFTLFAAFPGLMKKLPQSGGWMSKLKVILGFLEVALALKFLSNADLVAHWSAIKYELFLGVWALVALAMALYAFGVIKFPHDDKEEKHGWKWKTFGVILLGVTAYLLSGFRYNEKSKTFTSLSLLSGLAPPAGYSWMYPNHCPNNLPCFHDLEEGLAYSKQVNKPVMLDFTGWACVNCRKMEENVWPKPEIDAILRNDVVLISLYVDDKEQLPKELQGVYETKRGTKKNIKTVGDKWSTLQSEYFGSNTQPQYILMTPDRRFIGKTSYTPDVNQYKDFLICGLRAFSTK
jgi:thiol:disulfide interchange protein DsbD